MMDPITLRLPDRTMSSMVISDDAKLRDAANKMEAAFLSSMLQAAGLGAPRESLGGGIGEEQFASFTVQATAEKMVQRGGIGLAEALFHAMRGRADGQ